MTTGVLTLVAEDYVHEPSPHHLIIAGPAETSVRLTTGDGIGEFEIGGMNDRVVFLPSGSAVRLRAAGQPGAAMTLAMPLDLVAASCGGPATPWRRAFGERSSRLANVAAWFRRQRDARPHEDALIGRLTSRLAASTFGQMKRAEDDAWLSPAVLARISTLAESRWALRTPVALLAAEAGLSLSAFSRGFRGSTGLTPIAYLNGLRMDRAAALLASTDLPLNKIAREVGLASVPYLSEQFLDRFAVSPGRYRSSFKKRR